MFIKATQKYNRQAPRKVRLVANAVKGLTVTKAIEQLGLLERRASVVVLKVLSQAASNAQNNLGLDFNSLKIHSILINSGPSYKRFQPVSRGRAHSILKRTCHVEVTLFSPDKNVVSNQDKQPKLKLPQKKSKVLSKETDQTKPSLPQKATQSKPSLSTNIKATTSVKSSSPTRVLRHTTHK